MMKSEGTTLFVYIEPREFQKGGCVKVEDWVKCKGDMELFMYPLFIRSEVMPKNSMLAISRMDFKKGVGGEKWGKYKLWGF